MGDLKLTSASGSVTLSPENVAGTTTITVPSSTATLATNENFTSTGIDDNATSTAITIDSSENVGIGEASPTQKLHVAGNIYNTGYLNTAGSGTAGGVQFADANLYMYRDTNDLAIKLQGAEKVRIQSGGGISFNGDTASANALDDYEEGTSTIGISAASGSGGTVTGGSSGLYWTKIGDQVIVHGNLTVGSLGTLSGRFYITGFPFAAANDFLQGQGAVRSQGIGGSNDMPVVIEMSGNTSNARFHFASGTSGQRSVLASDISVSDFMAFTVMYRV